MLHIIKYNFYAEQLTDGNFALYGEFSNFNQQTVYHYKLIINKDLSIRQTKAFSIPRELGLNSKIRVFPNGQTHILSSV